MPHPSHRLPRSSTPALGQSLDCNPPLPLKLAVGEEFRASRLPTFIKGCCFPPPQLPCCHHHPTLAVARSHQMRLEEPGLPHLALDHTFTCHQPGKGCWVLSPAATISRCTLSSGLEVNRAVTRQQTCQRSGSLVIPPEKGHAESPKRTGFCVGSFSHNCFAFTN